MTILDSSLGRAEDSTEGRPAAQAWHIPGDVRIFSFMAALGSGSIGLRQHWAPAALGSISHGRKIVENPPSTLDDEAEGLKILHPNWMARQRATDDGHGH